MFKIRHLPSLVLLCIINISCNKNSYKSIELNNKLNNSDAHIEQQINEWYELTYYLIKHNLIGPTEASRVYAYVSIAIRELYIANSSSNLKSWVGVLNELDQLPRSKSDLDLNVMVPIVYYSVLDDMLNNYITNDYQVLKELRDSQLSKIVESDKIIFANSVEYAKTLSQAILNWSYDDGYDETRDMYYQSPSRDLDSRNWDITELTVDPLDPYWSTLRPLVLVDNSICDVEEKYEYNEEKNSDFYNQALTVYLKDQSLTEEEREIGLFWADCPGETATPIGHWFYIVKYSSKQHKLSTEVTIDLYAKLGVSVFDAFIQCWKTKYETNLLRPKTYIQEVIGHTQWEPLVFTPPFPEFVSGHSAISSCAARVLTDAIGPLSFIDSTHLRIGLKARRFNSFEHAASEAVSSRLFGGMHYPMSNELGMVQGHCVADKVISKIN